MIYDVGYMMYNILYFTTYMIYDIGDMIDDK